MTSALPDMTGISRGPLLLGHQSSGSDLRRTVFCRSRTLVTDMFPGCRVLRSGRYWAFQSLCVGDYDQSDVLRSRSFCQICSYACGYGGHAGGVGKRSLERYSK